VPAFEHANCNDPRIAHEYRQVGARSSWSEEIITDRGRPIALLKALDESDLVGKPFPRHNIRKMPKSNVDSTIYVSQDRDR